MNETFTNVQGDRELLDRVVDCWASLCGQRVVAYRATQRLDGRAGDRGRRAADGGLGRVGRHVHRRPGDRRPGTVVIEAAFGLGEVVVGGQVEPDTYVLAKDGPRLRHVHVGPKADKIVRGPDGHDQRLSVPRRGAGRAGC